MKLLIKEPEYIEVVDAIFCSTEYRQQILASISSRDITKSMVRVKSSNIWSYTLNVKDKKNPTGDLYVQFKGPRGGPEDVYVLYDVPVKLYKRFITAPSKGHFYWQYLRNNFRYSKLTGDKRGKLRNAIN